MLEIFNKVPGVMPDHAPGAHDDHRLKKLPKDASRATPDDERAATDPDGRTNDGPVTHNRVLPEGADHGGRDAHETAQGGQR